MGKKERIKMKFHKSERNTNKGSKSGEKNRVLDMPEVYWSGGNLFGYAERLGGPEGAKCRRITVTKSHWLAPEGIGKPVLSARCRKDDMQIIYGRLVINKCTVVGRSDFSVYFYQNDKVENFLGWDKVKAAESAAGMSVE